MGAGIDNAARAKRLPGDMDLAGIRHDDPTQDFDERRLAGTVLAETPADLAGMQLERDISSPRARVAALDNGIKGEHGLGPFFHSFPRPARLILVRPKRANMARFG